MITVLAPFVATGTTPATTLRLTTSYGSRPLTAMISPEAQGEIRAELAARDPLFDQLAYSRGRFLVTLPNGNELVIPAHPEMARVIEDCRG